MTDQKTIIQQTKKWITDVVIGCNFCPFAAKVVKEQKVRYRVEEKINAATCMEILLQEYDLLDKNPLIETTLLILPNAFPQFNDYLSLVAMAEKQLRKHRYEGIYQVASFHPAYCFAGEAPDDASNYTNRSPYPMLHLLREESIEKALANFSDPDSIPERNIHFAREKGPAYMQMLRGACFG